MTLTLSTKKNGNTSNIHKRVKEVHLQEYLSCYIFDKLLREGGDSKQNQ